MRKSKMTNTLVIVCDHTKPLYNDQWVEGVLHYTGMGKEGDQDFNKSQNKTLNESNENGIDVHLFEVHEKAKYTYRGQVKLVNKPYTAKQKDQNGNMRNVCVFPVKPISSGISEKELEENENNPEYIDGLSDDDLKNVAKERGKKNPVQKTVTTTEKNRDPYVSEYVKRRANGKCDLCGKDAPFIDKKGKPYLESHHVKWLSNGGEDTIYNAVGICPNCHRKIHVVNAEEDVVALQNALTYYKNNGL